MNIQSELTNIQNDYQKVNAEKSKERMGNSQLDQDAFLQLLMMQIKTQDPLNPMDNSQFISQQAQLTQLSAIQEINRSSQLMQASSLIGREVTLQDPDSSEIKMITGTVTEAKYKGTDASIVVNNKEYQLKHVKSIK